jgi:hypothetical protein
MGWSAEHILSLSVPPDKADGKFAVGAASVGKEAATSFCNGLEKLSTVGKVNAVGVVTLDAEIVGDNVIFDEAIVLLSVTGGSRQTSGKEKLSAKALEEAVVVDVEDVVDSAASAHAETLPIATIRIFIHIVFNTTPDSQLGHVGHLGAQFLRRIARGRYQNPRGITRGLATPPLCERAATKGWIPTVWN